MARFSGVSRRRFLHSGMGAASTVLLASGAARADRHAGEIRCGVIGTGGRGYGLIQATSKTAGVRVMALCDVQAGRLNQAAGLVAQDRPRLFSDYRRLIEYPELDAVIIATPCHLHAEMTLAALDAGLHCYCEKPMALTVRECDAVVRAVGRSGCVYQTGTQLRYSYPWQPAIRAVVDGELGRPLLIRAHRHNVGDYPRVRRWFFFREYSGDTITEQAVHEFDLFNWALGGVPERAAAFGGRGLHTEPHGRDILDHYTLSLDYGPKGKVSYSHSWVAPPGVPHDGRQEVVYCENGAVDVESGTVFPRRGDSRKVPREPSGDSTQLAIEDFFRCVREGETPLADAEAGRNGTLVALLGLRALDTGRVVTMKELLARG